ncbi:MAG: hypothetical protein AMJ84_04250 [Acidithiobacillales bacterium SM23_46]|jgi:rhodanese-related sulfurtransferase|nr:MAG: hypothetical protein AMJ84_04250 [Acidithiobacillales bacterium SM23_46]KPL27201.1 MAG: hypothetical protein AMJ72_10125 [Acidithiobacillales bacterium SM1_46]
MKHWLSVFAALVIAGQATLAGAAAEPFPHRAKYKEVQIMEIENLERQLDQLIVIDVRSKYEYDTMHIKGAKHIPLHSKTFEADVQKLRAAGNKPIVFYCNGVTCKKSYQATEKAMAAGIRNVYAYDAGLHGWAKRFPEHSVLLGKSPMNPADFLEKEAYKKRVISAGDFENRMGAGAIVLDIRDLAQRDMALFPFKEQRAQLDDSQKIAAVVEEAKRQKKTLLIYDKTGRQAPWFQYYLEQQGIKSYHFMEGGAEGYFEFKYGKLKVKAPDA